MLECYSIRNRSISKLGKRLLPHRVRTVAAEVLEPRQLLANDPIAHWIADDLRSDVVDGAAVTVWRDSVAGIEAVADGEPLFIDNAIEDRAAVRFNRADGLDTLRVLAAESPLNGADAFSIVVVFATDATNLNGGTAAWFLNTALLDGTDFFGTTPDWGLGISTSGQIAAGLGGPAASLYSTASGLNDGAPHVVVYTRNSGTISLYIDDQPADVLEGASTAPRTAVDMHFGAVSGTSFGLSGEIAEVQIFDHDLSGEAAATLIRELGDAYSFFAPAVADDQYSTTEDTPLAVAAEDGVLANDTNREPYALTTELIEGPQHGTLQLMADGSFLYQPDANYFGPDQFSYIANNSIDSPVAMVSIDVVSVLDRVSAVEDSYLVRPDAPLRVGVETGLLSNDPNPDQLATQALLTTPPQHGQLALASDGSLTYTPDTGYTGPDLFTYQVDDSHGVSPAATVRLEIAAGQVVINELMASNGQTLQDADGDTPDWFEVYNRSAVAAPLGGWYLTDRASDLTFWQIPDGVLVPPDGYLTLFASGKDRPEIAELHTNFRLDVEGDYLALVAPDGVSVESEFGPGGTPFPPQTIDISYGLAADGPASLLTPTPGGPNSEASLGNVAPLSVSVDHGFFESPFEVRLTTSTAAAEIRYTLDGSRPTATHGMIYGDPIAISSTTVLRAAAFSPGWFPTRVETRTYLFLADVLQQSSDGTAPDGWPDQDGSFVPDYGMDPEIVNDPVWGPQLTDALLQIPSLSLATDLEHLFDIQTGIYVNSTNRGREWERPASLELLDPNGSLEFQLELGVRIRGGFSRDPGNPKHGLRFFFRDVYGDGRLEVPLFGDQGADWFDNLDLRTAQNYSWSFLGDTRNTFLRDEFTRLSQGEMGQPYTRGSYYHLYINGQYWGLFQTEERPEASYAASYFGGEPEDYDTIKVLRDTPREVGASDGTTDALNRLREAALHGFSDNVDYYRVQGYEPDGVTRNLAYERLLDADNLIDFMILAYYSGDSDSPAARPVPNNMFGTYSRANPDGFKWFEHDSEHSLDKGAEDLVNPFIIEHEDFATAIATCPPDLCSHESGRFSPHWLHELLMQNADYRQRFADRVHLHFSEGGQLSESLAIDRIDRLASQFDLAIIAESARWGDASAVIPRTKDDWLTSIDVVKDWIRGRTDVVLEQLRTVSQSEGRPPWNWFPSFDAPQLSRSGGVVPSGTAVRVTADAGQLLYTLDGTDPRLPGGAVNPLAQTLDSGDELLIQQQTQLFVRSLLGTEWSAATEADYHTEGSHALAQLRISEVHYHPAPPTAAEIAAGHNNSDDFEFVEMVNIGPTPVDLGHVALEQVAVGGGQQGVAFSFAGGLAQQIGPGEHLLIVEDLEAFTFRYGSGLPVAGQWSGGLSNNREQLTLSDHGQVIQQFSYDDDWHPLTDGGGPSLEIVDPSHADLTSWGTADAWQPSARGDGTPGNSRDAPLLRGDFDGNEVVDDQDIDQLTAQIISGGRGLRFDLTDDGLATPQDRDVLIFDVLGTSYGDADLDGQVTTSSDGQLLLARLGQLGDWGWADADFDGDGLVSASRDGALLLAALAADRGAVGDAALATWDNAFAEFPAASARSTWEKRTGGQ